MCTAEFDEHSPIEGLGRVWLRRLQCPTPVVAQRLRARLGAFPNRRSECEPPASGRAVANCQRFEGPIG